MENVVPSASLFRFPPVPAPGSISVCGVANCIKNIPYRGGDDDIPFPIEFTRFLNLRESYHQIMGNDLQPVAAQKIPSIRMTEASDAFMLSQTTGWVKGLWNALLDGGFSGMAKYIQEDERIPVPMKSSYAFTTGVWESMRKGKRKLVVYLYPHSGLDTEDLIEKYSPVRQWKTSWLRALAWNPTSSKLAIALHDDSIRILTNGVKDGFPYIKSSEQKFVTSISWRPYSDAELAVGVSKGVLIWTLDASLKPTSNRSKLLTARNHSPVSCVQYSSNGRHLVSSSSLDSSIYVWDVATLEPFALHRYGGGGVPLVSWSPNGTQIFSNTPTSLFKVWSASNEWIPHRWKTSGKAVEAMCWSPDGSMIIFASGSILYTIVVIQQEEDFVDAAKARAAIPVFDIQEVEIQQDGTGRTLSIGGKVKQLRISPCGNQLAILFENSDVVPLFRVQKKSPDFLYPLGFVHGFEDEYPVAIEFQQNLKTEAVLTIAWSSTRLQQFPIVDNPSLATHISPGQEKAPLYRTGIIHRTSVIADERSRHECTERHMEAGDYMDITEEQIDETGFSKEQPKIYSSPS